MALLPVDARGKVDAGDRYLKLEARLDCGLLPVQTLVTQDKVDRITSIG